MEPQIDYVYDEIKEIEGPAEDSPYKQLVTRRYRIRPRVRNRKPYTKDQTMVVLLELLGDLNPVRRRAFTHGSGSLRSPL